MQPWIEHVSLKSILLGHHYDPGENGIAIRIQDRINERFLPTAFNFAHEFRYNFDDVEFDPDGIDIPMAFDIAKNIVSAYNQGINIIVSCHAGICRSGGVAQAAEAFGYRIANEYGSMNAPSPNICVKEMILVQLKHIMDAENAENTDES